MKVGKTLTSLSAQLSNVPALSPRQLWLLACGVRGFCEVNLNTGTCPGGIDRSTLAGLVRRGLLSEARGLNGIYTITPEGQRVLYAFAYVSVGHGQLIVEPATLEGEGFDD